MSQTAHKDYAGDKLGVWLFLFTELLHFGGLFLLYSLYFKRYPQEFATGGKQLNWTTGTTNTVILLASSLFAAMAVSSVQRAELRRAVELIFGTILCAAWFMVIKYVERSAKIGHGIYPGSGRSAGGVGILQPVLYDHRHPWPVCCHRRNFAGLDRGQDQRGRD